MNLATIESLNGARDGVNTVFTTPSDFAAGTVRLYKNGLAQRSSSYTTSGTNVITTEEPPKPGDVLQAFYRPI